jgi:hypothetical protein
MGKTLIEVYSKFIVNWKKNILQTLLVEGSPSPTLAPVSFSEGESEIMEASTLSGGSSGP